VSWYSRSSGASGRAALLGGVTIITGAGAWGCCLASVVGDSRHARLVKIKVITGIIQKTVLFIAAFQSVVETIR
jgi:glycerol-3-phosphate dehydrogenase